MYDVNKEILCNWMKVVEEDVTKNCLKRVRCKVSIVNDWNSLSSQCINCCTVNTLKNVFYLNWNWKLLNYVSCMSFEIAGIVWHIILCLLIPAVSLTLLASVESVKYLVDTKWWCVDDINAAAADGDDDDADAGWSLSACQVRVYQVGVHTDGWVYISHSDAGADTAQVPLVGHLHRLLWQLIHTESLARHGSDLHWHVAVCRRLLQRHWQVDSQERPRDQWQGSQDWLVAFCVY